MATQFQIYLTKITPILFVWIVTYFSGIPHSFEIFIATPIVLIGLLGIYAVYSVIAGVLRFRNCEEAKVELIREIDEARADFKRRNVKLD
uniref:Dolichol-phosphate mannosyltransferase subunit 3 n=1 Tax=Acrobeloides nanus TaxID=290746 RepID=A0A914CBW2_9BILA